MDNPCFLVVDVEPGVKSGIGFEVQKVWWKFESVGLEFGTKEGNDLIAPSLFKRVMIEIDIRLPGFIVKRQTADGGGEVDMEVAFEVASESVSGRIDARDVMFLSGDVFNDVGRNRGKFVEKMAVDPEERLELFRHGPSNVLPSGVGERVKSGVNPIVGGLFPAGGTETGFAGMRGIEAAQAFWTGKDMPAEQRSSTGKHFKHVNNDGFADQLLMANKEFPPVAVIDEDISDFDLTTDEFHRGTIVNLNVDER